MNLEIYKKGQGKYARAVAYGIGSLLILFGAVRLHATFNVPNKGVLVEDLPLIGDFTIYKVIGIVAFFLGVLLWHLVLNRPSLTDLFIDTEQEMRRVSWPSKKDVKVASIVVIIVTFIMGLSLYGFDKLLQHLFKLIF
jgi:preprotein translocase SecE subunit